MYDQNLPSLRKAYKGRVAEREKGEVDPWKRLERQHFLDALQIRNQRAERLRLLEVGAGTGKDSLFFQENGLDVVCTDLTPEMVDVCRSKGLNAQVMDFLHLDFPKASFDAIYALN